MVIILDRHIPVFLVNNSSIHQILDREKETPCQTVMVLSLLLFRLGHRRR
jgi:hypothetical protein